MITLKRYQEEAVEDLLKKSNKLIDLGGERLAVFQSPTGSGKTIMLAELIKRLVTQNKDEKSISVIWAAPRKLHNQSKRKLEEYYQENNILNCKNFWELTEKKIKEDEILFLNWESINKEKNLIVRENESDFYLDKIIENTKLDERTIVLVIDESHHAATSEISRSLVSDIAPNLTIEVSATPVLDSEDEKIKVYLEDVKNEGMIKKRVVLNECFVNHLSDDQLESAASNGTDLMLLDESLKKRAHIKEIYDELGLDINPLLLIQLPDRKSNEEDLLLDSITAHLNKIHEINESNDKLAIYLSEKKINLSNISKNNHPSEVLIFKQAIALGWDCPRAHILTLFRHWKSLNFSIQTIGRIMRMPEPETGHYKSEILNQSYVYTNIEEVKIQEDISNGYLRIHSSSRSKKTDLMLPSVYTKRQREKTRLNPSFTDIFLDLSAKYELKDKINLKNNVVDTNLLTKKVIEDHDSNLKFDEKELKLKLEKLSDFQKFFDYFVRDNLSPFFPDERSVKRVNFSIYKFFKESLKLSYEDSLKEIISIVLDKRNQIHFKNVLENSKEKYIDALKDNSKILEQVFNWDIPECLSYFSEVTEMKVTKSIMKPFFTKKLSKPEKKFINYLEASSKVDWWYKNGEQDNIHFAIPYRKDNEEHPFYVDFIVKFKDKKLGFFDTKDGITITEAFATGKAGGLNQFLSKNKNFVGGIIANTHKDNTGVWKCFTREVSEYKEGNFENWENINF